MTALGVRKVRLTGGEPLLRRDFPVLVRMLADVGGVEDLALTTNGLSLAGCADDLRAAGLGRVTVSLDALEDSVFRAMSGSRRGVCEVLAGVGAVLAVGLPVKINCVVQRGLNEDQILPLARYGRSVGVAVRFIGYMDVGNHNGWRPDGVVSSREVRAIVSSVFPLTTAAPRGPGETAEIYPYADGGGAVAFVSSVSAPFCGGCARARLAADGKLFTCFFAAKGCDLREPLRHGAGDDQLTSLIRGRWVARDDRYSEQQAQLRSMPRRKVEMSHVGG